MLSNRISYFFDLKGASMTLDTGCSTSIVALHLACQSLRTGESKISIVGGNNLILNPDMITAMSSFGFDKFSIFSLADTNWAIASSPPMDVLIPSITEHLDMVVAKALVV